MLTTSNASQEQAPAPSTGAPKGGLPGLPPRNKDQAPSSSAPKGGLPGLPPRTGFGGGGLPPRQQPKEASQERGQSSGGMIAPSTVASLRQQTATEHPPTPPQEREDSPKARRVKKQVQAFRVEIFRAALRLKFPVRHSILAQTQYRLGIAERMHLDSEQPLQRDAEEVALAAAERAEVLGEPFDLTVVVLIVGLEGVGKTALIHSLLGKEMPLGYKETKKVQAYEGEIKGIKFRFIDTPGLEASADAMARNLKTLRTAKSAWNRHKPSQLIYVERMDAGRRDGSDANVVKLITDVFGQDVWYGTLIALTHAGSSPPDNSSGGAMSYEMYAQNRQQQVQHTLRLACKDSRLLNPCALVETSPDAEHDEEGEPLLPIDGSPWRSKLLTISCVTKVMNAASKLLKPAKSAGVKKASAAAFLGGIKAAPMGFVLSRLLEFRDPQPIPSAEERRQLKQQGPYPVPPPQMEPTFDATDSSHHFDVIEDPQFLIIRGLNRGDGGGVDHAEAVDVVLVERKGMLDRRNNKPFDTWVQLTKDKNQLQLHSVSEASLYHNNNATTTANVFVQTFGGDLLYAPLIEVQKEVGADHMVSFGAIGAKVFDGFSLPWPVHKGAYVCGVKADVRGGSSDSTQYKVAAGRVTTRYQASSQHAYQVGGDLMFDGMGGRCLVGGSGVLQGRQGLVYGGNLSYERDVWGSTFMSSNVTLNNKGEGNVVVKLSDDYSQDLALSLVIPVLRYIWGNVFRGKREQEAY